MPDGARSRLPPVNPPPAPPFWPLGPDGGYDFAAIMAEAHLRTTLIRELHPWQSYPKTFRAQLRDAWFEALEAAGAQPIPEFLLEMIEEAEAERKRSRVSRNSRACCSSPIFVRCSHSERSQRVSQFTGTGWVTLLKAAGVRISMDGRGRCMDNIFIERLWRSLKHEAVYLVELTDGFHARRVIDDRIAFHNAKRPHSALGGATPDEACRPTKLERMAA